MLDDEPRVRHALVAIVVVAIGVGVFARPPIPQDASYHDMADRRLLLGIPNCLNVLSNVPFAIVGLFGLAVAFRRWTQAPGPFDDPWMRWPYGAVFVGAVLTAFGSSYYHLAPDNAGLVWDRLPMTLAFMGLLTAILGERVSGSLSRLLFGPLLGIGAASVLYWYRSELQGVGDLRPYVLVQFGSLVMIALLLLLYPGHRGGTGDLMAGLLAYAAAKAFELADEAVFARGHVISGHTLKHLAAAAGLACVAAMLGKRGYRLVPWCVLNEAGSGSPGRGAASDLRVRVPPR